MSKVYAVVFSVPYETDDTLWSVHTCPDLAEDAKAKAERGDHYAGSYGTFSIRVLLVNDAGADGGRPVCSARTKAGRRCRRATDWGLNVCKQHAAPVVVQWDPAPAPPEYCPCCDTAPPDVVTVAGSSAKFRTEVRGVWFTDGEGRTIGEGAPVVGHDPKGSG
jgi:hypothetical protein